MAEATVHLPQAMRRCTLQLRVTGIRVTKLRLWLGGQMLKLSALVMGCGIEIDFQD